MQRGRLASPCISCMHLLRLREVLTFCAGHACCMYDIVLRTQRVGDNQCWTHWKGVGRAARSIRQPRSRFQYLAVLSQVIHMYLVGTNLAKASPGFSIPGTQHLETATLLMAGWFPKPRTRLQLVIPGCLTHRGLFPESLGVETCSVTCSRSRAGLRETCIAT